MNEQLYFLNSQRGQREKNVDLDMLQEVEGVGVALAALAAADEAVVAAAEA